jgi:hypothetical protein
MLAITLAALVRLADVAAINPRVAISNTTAIATTYPRMGQMVSSNPSP